MLTIPAHRPRNLRLLILLAFLQVLAPSLAAVADAWRMDRREAYVHVESESSSSCVLVHADDCRLCSIATGVSGELRPRAEAIVGEQCIVAAAAPATHNMRRLSVGRGAPRAPPTFEG